MARQDAWKDGGSSAGGDGTDGPPDLTTWWRPSATRPDAPSGAAKLSVAECSHPFGCAISPLPGAGCRAGDCPGRASDARPRGGVPTNTVATPEPGKGLAACSNRMVTRGGAAR